MTVALASLTLALAGCGGGTSRTAPVKGKVTYKNKPVPNGTITFIPVGYGTSATGELGSDGSYTLTTFKSGDGAIPGKHKVIIVAMQDMSARLPEERNPLPPPIVPSKYTSIATTDLEVEVKEGDNTHNFDLKDETKR